MRRTVHFFDSTGEAYDATQCDEAVRDGDILVIESEGVIGIAHTWPVAVTQAYGRLHQITPGSTDAQYLKAANQYSSEPRLFEFHLDDARAFAEGYGYPLAPFLKG